MEVGEVHRLEMYLGVGIGADAASARGSVAAGLASAVAGMAELDLSNVNGAPVVSPQSSRSEIVS